LFDQQQRRIVAALAKFKEGERSTLRWEKFADLLAKDWASCHSLARSRTPGHLPLVNCTPAASSAARMVAMASCDAGTFLSLSTRRMVERLRPVSATTSICDNFANSRAARIWAGLILDIDIYISQGDCLGTGTTRHVSLHFGLCSRRHSDHSRSTVFPRTFQRSEPVNTQILGRLGRDNVRRMIISPSHLKMIGHVRLCAIFAFPQKHKIPNEFQA
jgi:hypothetical protein